MKMNANEILKKYVEVKRKTDKNYVLSDYIYDSLTENQIY